MVLVMANGQANNNSLTKNHPEWSKFINLLKQTSEELAKMIAQDGEGASKLMEVKVEGATTQTDAVKVAKSIVGSRSEEHTSELQSRGHLVCRLLLEKKMM